MLGQRRRWWTNIVPTLGERLVFAGIAPAMFLFCFVFSSSSLTFSKINPKIFFISSPLFFLENGAKLLIFSQIGLKYFFFNVHYLSRKLVQSYFYFVALIRFSRNWCKVFFLVALTNFSANRSKLFFLIIIYRSPALIRFQIFSHVKRRKCRWIYAYRFNLHWHHRINILTSDA